MGGLDFILLITDTLIEIVLDSQRISYNTHYRKYPWACLKAIGKRSKNKKLPCHVTFSVQLSLYIYMSRLKKNNSLTTKTIIMDTATAITSFFEDTILPLGIIVGLPVSIVWIFFKQEMNKTNKRAELIKLAIEHNTQADLSALITQINDNAKTGSLKNRLLVRLQWGAILTALGLGGLIFALWQDFCNGYDTEELSTVYFGSLTSFFVGIFIIIVFFVSKKMLKDELEAESKAARKD